MDHLSKDSHLELTDDRVESEPSDDEFATVPNEGMVVLTEEKPTSTEDLLFEASFESPATQPQESLPEEKVDLLGLDSDVPQEQNPPASEMSSSSSNADLLNNLLVDGTPQASEEPTGDLLGQGEDFFFSSQSHPSVSAQSTSSTAVVSSAGM